MSDGWPERDWFEKADQDLELARRALGPGKPLPGMACYHAQQCAEKYLKGYLIAHSVPSASCLLEELETSHKLIKAGFGSFQEVDTGNDFYYSEIALV